MSSLQPVPDVEALLAQSPYVRALARELVFDATLARDVEQETWLTALEHTPRDPAALRGWLASTVRNIALRTFRSATRRRAREVEHARSERAVITPAELLEREDLRRRLVEMVNALDEPYRSALVLRYLEGLEPRDVARRLDVPLETVRTRIKRGLELLRRRLDHSGNGDRGAWCLLLVRGFGLEPPSLAKLAAVTVSTSLSGAFGVLVMSLALVLGGTFLFVWLPGGHRPVEGAEPSPDAPLAVESSEPVPIVATAAPEKRVAVAAKSQQSNASEADLVNLSGRVLGPDGKPFAGADVYLTRWHWDMHYPQSQRDPIATTRSDPAGRFALSYSKADQRFAVDVERPEMWRHVIVSAFAPGFGPGWQAMDQLPAGEEAVLSLVPSASLRGRVLDLEGQPVAGVKVRLSSIAAFEGENLDDFLADPRRGGKRQKYLQFPFDVVVESGADGRFELRGIGRERSVRLDMRGSTITQTWVDAVTRSIEPITYGDPGTSEAMGSTKQVLYGDGFDWVVRPTRPITGIVRDAASGKPMAGVTVMSLAMSGYRFVTTAVETKTDASGRFCLLGMPKGEGNRILVVPNDEQPYFMKEVSVPDRAGMDPVEVEAELVRGLWVTGRVTDRATKKPGFGRIHYLPFLDNAAARESFSDGRGGVPGGFAYQDRYETDSEGRFRVVVLPGPAIVGVLSIGSYLQGSGSEAIEGQDEDGGYATFRNPVEASSAWPTSMRFIDPAPDATSITCDLELDPGKTLTVGLTDPAGKPVEHCEVRGSSSQWAYGDALDAGPDVTVSSLGPNERRLLRIHQKERCLGLVAYVSLAGQSKEKPVLRLVPCTTIVGRLLDQGGAPVGGVEVGLESGIDWDQGVPGVVSGADGRFRLEHVLPGVPFEVYASSGMLEDSQGALATDADVTWGTTFDLGDKRVKLR